MRTSTASRRCNLTPVLTCPGPAGSCNAGCQEGPPLCLPLCGPESGGCGMEPSLYFLQKTVLRCSSQSSSEALGFTGHQQPQQRPLEDTFLHLHPFLLCLVPSSLALSLQCSPFPLAGKHPGFGSYSLYLFLPGLCATCRPSIPKGSPHSHSLIRSIMRSII